MKVTNNWILKVGKIKIIKQKTYYDFDCDYNMNTISYEPIKLIGYNPKSILKKTKKGTITEIRSDKQVRFNDYNDMRIYHLTIEEKMDKSLHFQSIQGKRKYFY